MFTRVLILISLFVINIARADLLDLNSSLEIIENEKITLNFNKGEYLSLTLEQRPILEVKSFLEKNYNLKLIDRGEAHITLFNPMEWIKIKEYQDMIDWSKFENIQFESPCVGRGVLNHDSTYFVIVKANELHKIRNNIIGKIEKLSGKKLNLDPYRPHITIGFTSRDLHYQDGIDKSVCWIGNNR